MSEKSQAKQPITSNLLLDPDKNSADRKQAKAQLQLEHNLYAAILDSTSDLILVCDQEGRIVKFNRACEEVSGYALESIKYSYIWDFLLAPEDVVFMKSLFDQPISNWELTGFQQKHSNYWVTKSGEHRLISWTTTLFEEKGANRFVIYIGTDITEQQAMEESLRESLSISEEKFSKAFQCSPDPYSITTLEGQYVEINEAALELFGYKRHEVIGYTTNDLGIWVVPEDRDRMIKQIQEQGNVRNLEVKFQNKKGDIGTFLLSLEMIDLGGVTHLLCVSKEITQRKKIEEDLRLSEERFSRAFSASPSCIAITTLNEGHIIDVNESFCRIIGHKNEEVRGKTSIDIGFWADNTRSSIRQKLIEEGSFRDLEINFYKKSGEQRVGLYSAETIEIDGELCILNIVTDITERKLAEEEISYLSLHDNLTGLYNRAFCERELKRLDTEGILPLSLIMGDVNGLKLINDALGHEAGDKLLISVAEILRKFCRREDIIARWGGDEFIILLPGCDSAAVSGVFERIKEACKNIDDMPIQASVSLGLAIRCDITRDLSEVVKEAEDKMYRRKLMDNRSTRSTFLTSLEQTLWTRSHETEEHCRRIQDIVQKIGQLLNLPESELDSLNLLAVLHDIGKIAIPNSILDKPGKLTHSEWDLIKKHPETGYRIALSSPEMASIAEGILHHHEHWDGTGYPLGIKGKEIPLVSRIIAIADTYDVMINGRPYKKAVGKKAVCNEIKRCSGSQFDPEIVEKIFESEAYPVF